MPGNKTLLIAIPLALVVIGGGVYGAATMGLLKIPGITPKSKMGKIAKLYGEAGGKMYGEDKDKFAASIPKRKPRPETPKPTPKATYTVDAAKGAAAVAEVWNGIDTPQLVAIVKDWKDEELALVLANMDSGKASELLAAMESKRASKVSQELQALNSRVPISE